MTSPQYLGEVIASSTTFFTAQCPDADRTDATPLLAEPPAFGSFVRIDINGPLATGVLETSSSEDIDPFASPSSSAFGYGSIRDEPVAAVYAVIVHAETGALEAGRTLTAYGLDEAELRRSQPQIYELLATRFSAALIASASADGAIRPYLPPRPPRPHSRVWPVTADETRRLTERLDFLRPLLSGGAATGGALGYPADDLVAAMLRGAYITAYTDGDEYLLRVGRALAALLPLEYDRLRSIVERIIG